MAEARHTAVALGTLRRLVALAIAFALSVYAALSLDGVPPVSGDAVPVLRYERGLAPLRAALRAGDRVALLVRDDEVGPWYATQYALAPATVVRVSARDCVAARGTRCAAGATHVLAMDTDPAEVAKLGTRLGLVPIATSARGVLLGTAQP